MLYFTLNMNSPSEGTKTYTRKRLYPYITEITFQGKNLKVQINPKSETHRYKSSLAHALDTSGDLFNNLWKVIKEPSTSPAKSTSNTDRAKEDRKKGEIYIFSKSSMIEKDIRIPGYINLKEDRVEVVVFFHKDFDEKKIHYTKTYHVFAK